MPISGFLMMVFALKLVIDEIVRPEVKISELPEILWECCLTNAVVMMLIATCSVYSSILTYENLPTLLAENFFNLIQSKWAFLLILNLFLLVVGMFVDMTPALIMLVPMLIPLALKFGIDMVHLGLVMVINLAFGLTTPPVGTALFVALKVANLPMDKIIAPLLPLLACMCAVLLLVTYMPRSTCGFPAASASSSSGSPVKSNRRRSSAVARAGERPRNVEKVLT